MENSHECPEEQIEGNEDGIQAKSEEDHFLLPYLEHTKTLRGWYVAYGIGAPVLFISQPHIWNKISKAPFFKSILLYFLFGTLIQILLTQLNKIAMWCNYYRERNPAYSENLFFEIFKHYSDKIIIDIAIDTLSLAMLARATWLTFKIFIYTP